MCGGKRRLDSGMLSSLMLWINANCFWNATGLVSSADRWRIGRLAIAIEGGGEIQLLGSPLRLAKRGTTNY
jgi:hypothetical protein